MINYEWIIRIYLKENVTLILYMRIRNKFYAYGNDRFKKQLNNQISKKFRQKVVYSYTHVIAFFLSYKYSFLLLIH